MADEEKLQRKELHFMHCPKCGMKLIEVDYKSLKVDRCSACDGIWLDAGELEAAVDSKKGCWEGSSGCSPPQRTRFQVDELVVALRVVVGQLRARVQPTLS